MLSTAQAIIDANAKTFDLLMLIAVILLIIVTVWNIVVRALVTACFTAAVGFMALALLFLT
jgi:hypothetical protein